MKICCNKDKKTANTVINSFIPVLSGIFILTASLESTVPERMSTISMSQKLDMSIKGSTVNQNVFAFLFVFLKLEYNTLERYFSGSVFF